MSACCGVLVRTVHRVCREASVYVCACAKARGLKAAAVIHVFGVITLLAYVEKARAADGFTASGRLMCARGFACNRRIQRVRMCAGVLRQTTLYNPPS